MLADESLKAKRERIGPLVRQVKQRAEEVVPCADESEEADGRQGRLRQGQDDPAVDTELGAAIDPRRIGKLVRDRHEELAEEEDAERAAEERRNYQRQDRPDPAQPLED